jgi:hypothetical protein
MDSPNDTEDCELISLLMVSQDWHQLIDILVSRTNAQRQVLRQTFQINYGKVRVCESGHFICFWRN